jgi:hypothetical protein
MAPTLTITKTSAQQAKSQRTTGRDEAGAVISRFFAEGERRNDFTPKNRVIQPRFFKWTSPVDKQMPVVEGGLDFIYAEIIDACTAALFEFNAQTPKIILRIAGEDDAISDQGVRTGFLLFEFPVDENLVTRLRIESAA